MADEPSLEAKDLALIGKVEFRIAAASTDTKLEALLNTYLAPLLLKLASDYQSVRNKVISVCQHINTRIRAPSIKLPIATLLKQFKENQNALIRHFDLLYVQQGLERLPEVERLDLLPIILQDLVKNYDQSSKHAATLFNLFFRLLHLYQIPPRGGKEDAELREKLLLNDEKNAGFVASCIGKLFLYNANLKDNKSCPGLSVTDCEFLQLYDKPDTWVPTAPNGLSLVETKVRAAKLLASGAFVEDERFVPALIASADSNSRLTEIGEDILKRALPAISKEDEQLVQGLYHLYLGSSSEHNLPASIALQTRILPVLASSKKATEYASEILQIVERGLTNNEAITNTSSKGLATSKLRTQIFSFVSWIAKMGPKNVLAMAAPEAVTHLREYIDNQGWPSIAGELKNNASELQLRAYGYESIGILAQACPEKLLYEENLDLLRWYFQSLGSDTSGKDVTLSIEQGMASILTAFSQTRDKMVPELISLLSDYASITPGGKEDSSGITMHRSTRYVAVRFSNRCLPFSNAKGRLIALLALSGGDDERREVIEEGKRGLDPYWYGILNPTAVSDTVGSANQQSFKFPRVQDLVPTLLATNNNPLYSTRAFGDGVVFCWTILLHEALQSIAKSPVIDTEWQRNITALVENDEEARAGVKDYLARFDTQEPTTHDILVRLTRAAFEDYSRQDSAIRPLSGRTVLEILQLGPESLLDDPGILTKAHDLKSTIFCSFSSARILSGRILGLLASRISFWTGKNQQMLEDFFVTARSWSTAVGSDVHRVHGSLVSIANVFSRGGSASEIAPKTMDFLGLIFTILKDSRDKDLLEAALLSIGQLSLFGVMTPTVVKAITGIDEIVKKIAETAKKGNENAINTLGYIAIQCKEDEDETLIASILTILYGLHEVRQAEAQFAVGSALSCLSIGSGSKALLGVFDKTNALPEQAARSHTLQDVLERVLRDCKTTKPALRQASVIWLLCLVQYCGHESDLIANLRQCQNAFKSFLADKDSINQEVASKGLTLIYEKGDKDLKDDLVRDLVTSFTSTKSNLSGNVSEETELFEPGALPTGEGQSVTTYKDIISLATEVGNPGLVYQFMSLASNSAIWSTRSAFGRFGLSQILDDANKDGSLAQNSRLYSSLFRYRFDPNTNVRAAMNEIWNSLVKDPKATIEKYFEEILQDLFKSILNKEWRTRQASCAAIADLLQGRPLSMYEQHLTRIWELTFKVCDDIKGSVRVAAMALARVLTGILVRSLEAGEASSSTANAMLQQVLPFLLGSSGLESAAQDIQNFSLVTLLDIIKKSNAKILRPFIADLIGRLLSLLTSIEPGVINYVYLNAEKYGITTQEIDDARLSSVKMSPMMEAIERCLDMLDDSVMLALETTLINANKTVIGLPSRVGLCRVMVSLATRHRILFKPYAGNFLKLLRRQVMDRNDTISTSAAVACGYLCRLATDRDILAAVEHAREMYFDSEDDRHRTIAGEVLLAIAKHATDRFASLASDCLPFAFFGQHDVNKEAKDLFKAAWEENAGGSRAVLLYLREIINISIAHLDSPRWDIKFAASYTVADTVKMASEISDTSTATIWPALLKAMNSKTWNGKEKVLEAFALFWKKSIHIRSTIVWRQAMEKIIIRETKRNNPGYRVHALKALGDMVETTITLDQKTSVAAPKWFTVSYPAVSPILEEYLGESSTESKEDDMDIDAKTDGGPSSKDLAETTVANALRVMILSSAVLVDQPEEFFATCLSQTLPWLRKGLSHPSFASRKNILLTTLLEALKLLFQHLDWKSLSTSTSTEAVLVDLSSLMLFTSTYNDLNESLRQSTAAAALNLASGIVNHRFSRLEDVLVCGATEAKSSERSQAVTSTWMELEKVLKKD